ncbi:beta-glucosidase [Jatrophihabitans sp. GAS493]|uniref:glycoside hydrolase family 3 C-terminal domain-containing protein n=1 Tax=Jatrophihabitans sp. GAS493 TaxID=1907575 RepID=UPI000BBFC3B1|nr:glycoside hydrolase family 3 C-terminal domain-containing protein [Jatrophihabitans sp. GAS493]SOD74575.1 beta-glucosidase [Jatrophihabitans sp. GAS493]
MSRRTTPFAMLVCLVAALLVSAFSTAATARAAATRCPWVGSTAPVPTRVSQVVAAMSLGEKITLLHGQYGSSYAGLTPAIPDLCIPAMNFQDGPAGVGDGLTGVTQLPAPVAAAATWDPVAERQYGAVLGAEQAGKGTTITLAPTVNLVRDPRWGRAFESTGEDPYLAGRTGSALIQGIQSQGELAQVKHLAAYNQETNRNTAADNAVVSTRALQELYLPAFGTAVKSGAVASAMCSYSTVNGTPACQNNYLQNSVLRSQLGFNGFVTSDWFATKSTVASANGGLNIEMPGDTYFGSALSAAVGAGTVSVATIDSMVSAILTQMFGFGLFDRAPTGSPTRVVTTDAHIAVARAVAAEGTVLLKNTAGTLPITAAAHTIAVIGDDAADHPQYTGGGSANVRADYQVAPLLGIQRRAPAGTSVLFDPGLSASSAAATAAKADVAVVFASKYETEDSDLSSIDLDASLNTLIRTVAAANRHTVVVLNTGSAVTMPWIDEVAGVLEAWYPGQENGTAIAQVLFGDVNPAGHLPVTFPRSLADVPAQTTAQWPGLNGNVQYSEGLQVGYRWYDQQGISPLFPFGYGLSYTTFAYSDLRISPINAGGTVTVGATITNTGTRSGSDVAQLYITAPAVVGEPPKQLKGYKRVTLSPGASTRVYLPLNLKDLAAWSTSANAFVTTAGTYGIWVGDSSRDLPLHAVLPITSGRPGRTVSVTNPGPLDVTAGVGFTRALPATDSARATLRFSATGLPAGVAISSSGQLSGTPLRAGTSTVAVTASDAAGASGSATFIVTVNPAPDGSALTGPVTGLGGLCLDVRGASDADATAVEVFLCNGTNAQQWTRHPDGTLRALGKCLDVASAGRTDATPVQLYTCNGTAAQQWTPSSTSALVNTGAGLCLDVPAGLAVPGVQLQIYHCNGTAAQRWLLS